MNSKINSTIMILKNLILQGIKYGVCSLSLKIEYLEMEGK